MSRKIDALCAEHVMGLEVCHQGPSHLVQISDEEHSEFAIPHYSTDIAAAWQIVEECVGMDKGNGYCFRVNYDGGGVVVSIGRSRAFHEDSVCMAICLAALKSKGIEP